MRPEATPSSHRELIGRVKRGDEIALGELLSLHRNWLKDIAAKGLQGRVPSRMDASDVVQQTLLSVVKQIHQFTGSTSGEFQQWLKRIHERNIQDALRRHVHARKRRTSVEIPLSSVDAFCDLQQNSPGHNVIRSERAEELERILETLPDDQAKAVKLRHLEGWSLARMATHFGRSRDSVASLLKRGVENLRKRVRND